MGRKIKTVALDFGGVIAPADISIVHKRFIALGVKDIDKYINMIRQEGLFGNLEQGLISQEEFRKEISKKAGREVTLDECGNACRGFFSVIPEENQQLMRKIKELGYRLVLLSNTNPFITDWTFSSKFDGHGHAITDYMDALYLSYQLKVMKPDEKIFRIMIEREGLEPGQILFADDGPSNIETAQRLGINTFKVTNGESWTEGLLAELNRLEQE